MQGGGVKGVEVGAWAAVGYKDFGQVGVRATVAVTRVTAVETRAQMAEVRVMVAVAKADVAAAPAGR